MRAKDKELLELLISTCRAAAVSRDQGLADAAIRRQRLLEVELADLQLPDLPLAAEPGEPEEKGE